MYRKTVFLSGILMLLLVPLALTAADVEETDDTGDVWHWKWSENTGSFTWEKSTTGKSDIDITELTYSMENQQVTLRLMVHGSIRDSNDIVYWAYYNTSDANYWMTYHNGQGYCYGSSTTSAHFSLGNVTASDDTITATVNAVGTGPKEAFYGWAAEYTTYGDTNAEWWGDWAPQINSPWYGIDSDGDGDSNGGDDTPGFGLIIIGAFVMGILVKRKQRN